MLPILLLLFSCSSKRDTCARFAAKQITYQEAADKLGVKLKLEKGRAGRDIDRVYNFCEYYKN